MALTRASLGYLLLGGLLLCCSVANAGLKIEVTQGLNDPTPIAIVPFSQPSQQPTDNVSDIISNDLTRSGMFDALPSSDLLSRPTSVNQVIFRDFRVLAIPYITVGSVKRNADGNYTVRFALLDANREKTLASQTYDATASQLRGVAHRIADKIFEQLTGVKGVFATKILYVTYNPKGKYPYQLHYADADGARAQAVLRGRQPIMSPTWSPDGKKIAYVSFERDGLPAIFVHSLATGKRRLVSHSRGINGAPSFSPDGRKLAMTLSKDGNAEIYVLDLSSNVMTRITNNYAIDTEACWMPDSRTLLFTSSRSGGPQIYQKSIGGSAAKRVTFNGRYNAKPSITPDGRFLVYIHRQDGSFSVAVQDLENDAFRLVTKTKNDESPSVAPNGSMVIYGSLHDRESVLEVVSIDGKVKMRLPSEKGNVRDPSWSPYF